MRRDIVVVIAAIIIAGCASNRHWVRADVTQAQATQDLARCELMASQLARAEVGGVQTYSGPVRRQIYISGSVTDGINTYNYNAQGYTQGATPSQIAAYNAGASFGNGFAYGMADAKYKAECMQARGYHLESNKP